MLRACDIDVDPETVGEVITANSHPRLCEALTIVAHDSGAGASRTEYGIPPEWVSRLPAIEAALAALSQDDLENICIGEETDMEEVAGRSEDLRMANGILADFFDEWPPAGEEVKP